MHTMLLATKVALTGLIVSAVGVSILALGIDQIDDHPYIVMPLFAAMFVFMLIGRVKIELDARTRATRRQEAPES